MGQKPIYYDLDVIRSERRRNSDSIYNLKQYRGLYRHSTNDENNSINENVTDGYYNHSDRNLSKRKLFCQILPNKFITDKRLDEELIENVSNNHSNRRRTSDTYSPYGTRNFPSLRQRSPSIDSNLSVSINGLDFTSRKSDVHNTSNGTSDCNSFSSSTAQSHKDFIVQLPRPAPLTHHRISLTAPLQSSKSASAYNGSNKSKNLLPNATLIPNVK